MHQNEADSSLRWLYADFNSYFASVEQQLQPQLRGQPVAVIPVATDSTCVIAASYEAKAFGVKTGTPVWEAMQHCPGLIFVLARHERYVEYHHRIVEEVERHIPVTAVCSIDEVACRLMDNEIAESRAKEIALSIKQGLAKNVGAYIRCSIGIAPNRFLAKVATDLQKPDGLTVLSTVDLPARLLSLELRDLPGIGRNMERRLQAAGVDNMHALWALDAERMRKIWGSLCGEKLWHLLHGIELPEEETTRRTIGHSHVIAPELRDPDKAKFVARRLTLKAASRLRRMEYYAGALSLSARIENGPRLQGGLRCYRAQDSITFLHLLDKLWDRLMEDAPGARIRKVAITLHDLTAVDEAQPTLFDSVPEDSGRASKAVQLSRTLDKINYRFGRDSVLIGMLPSQGRSFSGSKIAFTRIPDLTEFLE